VLELVEFGFALGEVLPMALNEAGYWSEAVRARLDADGG